MIRSDPMPPAPITALNPLPEDAAMLYPGQELAAMDHANNYHRWILDLFRPYLGARAAEVGAGIGSFSRIILETTAVQELTALEPAANLFPILQGRLQANPRAQALPLYLDAWKPVHAPDSIAAVNVMEHIQDDEQFLRDANRILAPGGTILLFVPALPQLYGKLDAQFGHFRRYLKPELAAKLKASGFHLERLHYVNFTGIVSWYVTAKVLGRTTISASSVQFYDRVVIPIVRRLEALVTPPVGQNLVAVGRKL
jgi:SAM-dependent methyltransferase